jgi:O-succinylbenzoic acid--CoA ligase
MLSLDAFLLKTQELNSTAIQTLSSKLTYDQLQADVLKTGQSLLKLEIKEDENVAIVGYNDVDYIKLVLALWQIKAVPVLINPKLSAAELEQQISTSNCKNVLVGKNTDSFPTNLDLNIINYPFKQLKDKEELEFADSLDPAASAIIIFTAGTTGSAKGVELSFNSIKQSAKNGDQIINHNKNDRWLASLPFYHIGGFSIITRALMHNASINIPKSLDTSSLKDAFKKYKPNYCSLVPTQLKRLLEAGVKPNKELKNVLVGGGVIDQKLISNAVDEDWHVTIVYGSTETASFITALTEDEVYFKPGSVGKAVKPNKVIIVNDNRHQLDIGEVGFVTISSTSLMKGYHNNPEETETKIENGFYYSDDIAHLDDEGYLFLAARKDDMIITGGENVYPFEVENRIIEHPDIYDVGVFPLEDDEWGEIVCAAIALNDNRSEMSLAELTEFLEESLAPYKIPKKIFIKNVLPRNELGKLSRAVLAEMFVGE